MSDISARNYTIDFVKFLACPFVLLIHCPLSGELGQAVIHFGRFAVPFFLLVSGWFSYVPSTETIIARARKKLLDTVKLLGTFLAAYILMNSLAARISGQPWLSWIGNYTDIRTLAYFVLFNRALFFGSTGYYPFMLIYVYVIFLFLLEKKLVEKIFWTIPVLLAANILLAAFTDIPWFYYGNFLFTGLPFFLMGHWLHKSYNKLPDKPAIWFSLFLAGTGIMLMESAINRDCYCYFGSIIMAGALLMFSVNYKLKVAREAWVQMLRRFSTYIFVIHCGVRDMLQAFLNSRQILLANNVFVLMVILACLVVCVLWDCCVRQIKK